MLESKVLAKTMIATNKRTEALRVSQEVGKFHIQQTNFRRLILPKHKLTFFGSTLGCMKELNPQIEQDR